MNNHTELSSQIKAPPAQSRSFRRLPKDESPPSPLAKILLQNIAESPFEPISRRYKKLGLSNAAGNSAKEELINKGLIQPQTVDGKTLLELTQKARGLIKDWGVNICHFKGGIEHAYWVEKLRQHFNRRQGFTFIEKDDIDLVVVSLKEDNETLTAIQVETGKSSLKKNIKTLLAYQADEKCIIATNKPAEIKLKSLVPANSGISVTFAKDFLKST